MQDRNKTYQPRTNLKATENTFLKSWAISIQDAESYTEYPIWWPRGNSSYTEAGEVEVVVGGAYISLLSRLMKPSNSQYSMSFIVNESSRPSKIQTYRDELMPEPSISCRSNYAPIHIYREVYGYNPPSTIDILSMVGVIAVVLVSLLGSVWQWRKGGIIKGWTSIPEYAALCLGTDPLLGGIENTCAGITSKETMKTFVKVRETTVDHLELIASPPPGSGNIHGVNLGKKYG